MANRTVRYGDIMRQHWHGPNVVLRADVPEPEADAYLEGPEAARATEPGARGPAGTFDHFVPRRWGSYTPAPADAEVTE